METIDKRRDSTPIPIGAERVIEYLTLRHTYISGVTPTGGEHDALQATGSDSEWGHQRGQLDGKTWPKLASGGQMDSGALSAQTEPEVLSLKGLGGNRRKVAEVVRAGIEPATHGFSVRCSTN